MNTDDMKTIMKEVALGLPPSLVGKGYDQFRLDVAKDMGKDRKEGLDIQVPND